MELKKFDKKLKIVSGPIFSTLAKGVLKALLGGDDEDSEDEDGKEDDEEGKDEDEKEKDGEDKDEEKNPEEEKAMADGDTNSASQSLCCTRSPVMPKPRRPAQ